MLNSPSQYALTKYQMKCVKQYLLTDKKIQILLKIGEILHWVQLSLYL
jgi:hypothetical protein